MLKATYLGAYIINWLFKPQLASLKVPLHRTWKVPFILMQMQHRCILRYDLLQPLICPQHAVGAVSAEQ